MIIRITNLTASSVNERRSGPRSGVYTKYRLLHLVTRHSASVRSPSLDCSQGKNFRPHSAILQTGSSSELFQISYFNYFKLMNNQTLITVSDKNHLPASASKWIVQSRTWKWLQTCAVKANQNSLFLIAFLWPAKLLNRQNMHICIIWNHMYHVSRFSTTNSDDVRPV